MDFLLRKWNAGRRRISEIDRGDRGGKAINSASYGVGLGMLHQSRYDLVILKIWKDRILGEEEKGRENDEISF